MMAQICNMKKYFKIYLILIKNAVSREAQFRADTWMNWFTHLIYLGFLFILFDILFTFTKEIAGWSKPEVFLLVIIFTLSQQLFHFFFRDNMFEIPNIITEGRLDNYLVSPANTIFLVISRQVSTKAMFRIFTQLTLLAWLFYTYDFGLTAWSSLGIILLIIVGLVIQTAFYLILNTLSFWFLRIDNINDAWFNLSQLGRYPLSVLPQSLSIFAFTMFPIAYQSYVPVGVGLGKLDWGFFALTIIWAAVTWILALTLWNRGVRTYESASG